jgi:hypothetical protein
MQDKIEFKYEDIVKKTLAVRKMTNENFENEIRNNCRKLKTN